MTLTHILARPLVTRTDWQRLADAKLALELRHQADIHRANAASCLRSIQALMEQYDDCTDLTRRSALADRLDAMSRRYDDFIATARADEAQAEGIERELKEDAP